MKNFYGKIFIKNKENQIICESNEDFEVKEFDKKNFGWIDIISPDKKISCRFQKPLQVFRNIHNKKPINCLDISIHGTLCVSGSNNGELKIWDINDGTIMRELKGHIGDILTCKFFPSGQVIVSGGSDFQLKIWDIHDGECAAILKGHVGGILDVGIIDRGRNIISTSRDGTARLWECASQTTISVIGKIDKPINSCYICKNTFSSHFSDIERKIDPRESGTSDKLVLLGCEDGTLKGIDLRTIKEIFSNNCNSAVNCCCSSIDNNIFIAGNHEGFIYIWDIHNLNKPLNIMKFDQLSSILQIKPTENNYQFWISSADGLCFLCDLSTNQIIKEFTGSDFEPIYTISINKDIIVTGGRDSYIRKYRNM
jgi:proteasomal ATPase-associated factor 1